jgi:chitinase
MRLAQRVFAIVLLLGCGGFGQGHKRLMGYYPDWAKDQTPAYTAATIPYSKVTHILHAFLLLDPSANGALQVDPELLEPALIRNAHKAGVKVIISIGGADSTQEAAFSTIAASAHLRSLLAKNVLEFVRANGYDGVDIDWEVPNAPTDTTNCTMLMEALRRAMPSPYLISMAISADPRNYGTGFDVPALAPIVDFFNVMTYDFTGPWSDMAGLNSPLFQDPSDPEQEGSLKTSMDLYEDTYGVPADKINMGTAFYGYEFDGVQNLWNYCPASNCNPTTNSYNYGTYIKQRVNAQGWARHWDASADSPYLLYEGPGGKDGFITYDDIYSTGMKASYVLGKRGFGGIFMWDISGDYDGKSQDLLDEMYDVKYYLEHLPAK